jgi:hypothetical protein
MMPRWLYLWPLHFVEIGYIIFGAIFLLARERSHGKTKKADRVYQSASAFAPTDFRSYGIMPYPVGAWFVISA